MQKTIDSYFSFDSLASFGKQSIRMKKAISSFKKKNIAKNASAADSCTSSATEDLNLSEEEQLQPKTQKNIKSSIIITKLNNKQLNTQKIDMDQICEIRGDIIIENKSEQINIPVQDQVLKKEDTVRRISKRKSDSNITESKQIKK